MATKQDTPIAQNALPPTGGRPQDVGVKRRSQAHMDALDKLDERSVQLAALLNFMSADEPDPQDESNSRLVLSGWSDDTQRGVMSLAASLASEIREARKVIIDAELAEAEVSHG